MLRGAGAGDNTHTFLQVPAKDHLSYRFSVCCCDLLQYRIIQKCFGIAPSAQRIPALNDNPFILDVFHHGAVLIVGVDLILNQSRFYGNLWQEKICLLDVVTGYTSGAHFAVLYSFFDGLICRRIV